MADRFQYLHSAEAETPVGLWGWAKRLVDELNKLALELVDCCTGGGSLSGAFDFDDGDASSDGAFELDDGGA